MPFFMDNIFTDNNMKNPCVQYVITNEMNFASFGDLSQVINFEMETICVKFTSTIGMLYSMKVGVGF